VAVPAGHVPAWSFPTRARIAEIPEHELRECKMGFRAPYLRETAQMIMSGEVNLDSLGRLPLHDARCELVKLPGVGAKIADCALLFGFGFDQAFPVDVWVMKALRQLYFPRRRVSLKKLRHFTETHFGPHSGYAQQYLFHYMRTKAPAV
jgi:N-glycosylase/DNA lyase